MSRPRLLLRRKRRRYPAKSMYGEHQVNQEHIDRAVKLAGPEIAWMLMVAGGQISAYPDRKPYLAGN